MTLAVFTGVSQVAGEPEPLNSQLERDDSGTVCPAPQRNKAVSRDVTLWAPTNNPMKLIFTPVVQLQAKPAGLVAIER